jgi:hypothetical protein
MATIDAEHNRYKPYPKIDGMSHVVNMIVRVYHRHYQTVVFAFALWVIGMSKPSGR